MRRTLTALTATVLLTLTGCGTSQPTQDEREDDTAATAEPITLTDADGRTVELSGPAENVVTTEWQLTESVLSLGVEPAAVADPEGYATWDSAEPLPDGVRDVGLRGEVSLDAIFEADPDLVIVPQDAPELATLEERDVPVLVIAGADAADPIAQMKESFTLIAQALGREDVAEDVLGDFDAAVAEASSAVEAAQPETTEFAYADAYIVGSTVSIRPFGQGSYVGELGEAIGLTNVWAGEVDDVYGLGQTDVEGLAAIGDVNLFYTGTESGEWVSRLEENAVWTNAPFVQNGKVTPFPESTWTFGGPRSGEQILGAFVTAVT